MSDTVDTTDQVTNEKVEQVKIDEMPATEEIKPTETSGAKAEAVKTEDVKVEDTKPEDTTVNDVAVEAATAGASETNADNKENGATDDKATADGDDDANEHGEASPDHKRKRRNDADQSSKQKRGRYDNARPSNIKSTFDMEESKDHDEILRQVEFYFSDSNLPIDKYLLQLTGGHDNLPVPLKTIHNFKRMKHFQPYSEVVKAVKSSQYLNLDEEEGITRKTPLDEKFGDDIEHNKKLLHSDDVAKSIYAKGFGNEQSSTHRDIEAFFDTYGPIKSVRLRRFPDNTFKGSVFVEFATPELQKQFLDLDPKPQWEISKGEMVDLQIMSKMAYVDMKHNGIIEGLVIPNPSRRNAFKPGRGRDRGGKFEGGRGGKNFGGKNYGDNKKYNDRKDRRGRYDDKRDRKRRYDDDDRGDYRRKRSRDDDNDNDEASRSRSRSYSRSPSRSPDRGNRSYKRRDYDGEGDNWRDRRDHDQKEDRRVKESRRHKARRESGEDRDEKRSKRSRDGEEDEDREVKRSKQEELTAEAEAVAEAV